MNVPTYRIGLVQAQAYRQLQLIYHTALEPYGLTIPEWSLLGIIYDEGTLSLTQITAILQSKASHPTVLVERLVQQNLLKRESVTSDKRVKMISITRKGRELVPHVERHARVKLSEALSGLSRAELNDYFDILKKISKSNYSHSNLM